MFSALLVELTGMPLITRTRRNWRIGIELNHHLLIFHIKCHVSRWSWHSLFFYCNANKGSVQHGAQYLATTFLWFSYLYNCAIILIAKNICLFWTKRNKDDEITLFTYTHMMQPLSYIIDIVLISFFICSDVVTSLLSVWKNVDAFVSFGSWN